MTDDTQGDGPPDQRGDHMERFQVSQAAETPLTTLATPFGSALYLYARSSDSLSAGTIGQDYIAFRYNAHNLTFAVCDGVGQSFMGDLAARLLGDGLNDWLWSLEQRPESARAFSKAVAEALDALASKTARQVADYGLPAGLPPLVVQALEMQRAYGSESMFVAGRLALGGDRPWIALCWLGDSPVAAIDIDGRLVDLGPRGHTSERWNARTGIKGAVHAWVGGAEHVARVAGYTDGLGHDHVPTDADLAKLMELWAGNPPADDAALFDVRLAPSPATTGQAEAPAPEDLRLPAFIPDRTRPIVVESERTPVRDVQPIEAGPPVGPVLEGWRPLTEKPAGESPEEKEPGEPAQPPIPQSVPEAAELLTSLSSQPLKLPPEGVSTETQKQVQMWQQAALLGLTSAALAMLMVERLMREQPPDATSGEP